MKKVTAQDSNEAVDEMITLSKSNHGMKKVTSSQSEEEAVSKMIALSKNNHDMTDMMKPAAIKLEVDGDKPLTPKKCLIEDSSDAVECNVMPKLLHRLKTPWRQVPENTAMLQKFVFKLRNQIDANVHDFDWHLFGVKCG